MKAGRNVLQQIVRLKGGRSLVASFSYAPRPSRLWAVYLPESGREYLRANRDELRSLVGAKASRELNFLIINKPGLEPGKVNEAEFERSFRRERRVEDALTALKEIVPKDDKIHLIGYSEGAYLAPQVARRDSRVISVTMLGGGTRGWLKEELNIASRKKKPLLARKIKEIYKNPTPRREWLGFSYATWYSYRGDSTLRALREIEVPALAVVGARDRVIDVKSAIKDLRAIGREKDIELHVLDDCGHHFHNHWEPVRRVLSRFLSTRASR